MVRENASEIIDIVNSLIAYIAYQNIKKAQVILAGGNIKKCDSLIAEAIVIYSQDIREFGQRFKLASFDDFLRASLS